MKGIKFTEKIIIVETPDVIFDFTQDYTKRLSWDKFLKKAALMDGASAAAKGVRVYCVSRNGVGILTEYISYDRPKVTAVRMTDASFIFKSFLGSWNFKSLEKEGTEVAFLYSFTLHFPFSLVALLVKHMLRRSAKQRLIYLKNSMEANNKF